MDFDRPAFDEVARVSRCKALAVAREADDVVIAADTIVVVDGRVLGKPRSAEEAVQMLQWLSDRDHQVMTGVTVLCGQREMVFTEVTDLHFRALTDSEIRRYVQCGEPMDKAGAYGIQGRGCVLVKRIEGDFFNVMGLPVARLKREMERVGALPKS